MDTSIIKYYSIIFCSLYSYFRFTNANVNKKELLCWIPYSMILAIVTQLLRTYYAPLNLVFMFLAIFIFVLFKYKKNFTKSAVFSLIAISIGFITNVLALLITFPVFFLMYLLSTDVVISEIVDYSMSGIIQPIILYFILKIKRFRNLYALFENKIDDRVFMLIGSIMLVSTALLYTSAETDHIVPWIALITLIGLTIFLLIKKYIFNQYLKNIHNRNINILEGTISEQTELISKLTSENEKLSKIIHRDNKIIPAMEMAVEEILQCPSPDLQKERSRDLLRQLKVMSSERSGILSDYEKQHIHLPKTGISSVDASLQYLSLRAKNKNVLMELSVLASAKGITEIGVQEDDINTLVLDIVENAIIAVSHSNNPRVLVVFGMEDMHYCISVYDNGEKFDSAVIKNLGKKRITTHKKNGGSGIGLMTTIELLTKYKASFLLDEKIDNELFVKRVAVLFDNRSEKYINI